MWAKYISCWHDLSCHCKLYFFIFSETIKLPNFTWMFLLILSLKIKISMYNTVTVFESLLFWKIAANILNIVSLKKNWSSFRYCEKTCAFTLFHSFFLLATLQTLEHNVASVCLWYISDLECITNIVYLIFPNTWIYRAI